MAVIQVQSARHMPRQSSKWVSLSCLITACQLDPSHRRTQWQTLCQPRWSQVPACGWNCNKCLCVRMPRSSWRWTQRTSVPYRLMRVFMLSLRKTTSAWRVHHEFTVLMNVWFINGIRRRSRVFLPGGQAADFSEKTSGDMNRKNIIRNSILGTIRLL